MRHTSQPVSVIQQKIRFNVFKMKSVLVVLIISVSGLVSAKEPESKEIVLKAITDEAVHGKPFTLSCSVKPNLKPATIFWYRKGTAIFVSGLMGYTKTIDVNRTEIVDVRGRYFINMHGSFRHHLTLLIDSHKDEGSSWTCRAEGFKTESNMITLHTTDPEGPAACGIRCIFGVATGVTVGILIIDLLVFTRCLSKRI